jgi:uncharacterized protein (DUF1778 family)
MGVFGMRLSIEMTAEQHQRLKAAAALQGKSIKDYVLERACPDSSDVALRDLEAFLKPRIERARKGAFSVKSVAEIFDEVSKEQESNK